MKYVLKAGALYDAQHEQVFARIKRGFIGSEKEILSAEGTVLSNTVIRNLDVPAEKVQTVRFREYIMRDGAGRVCAVARPDYAEGDDPTKVGWPICRMPQVDHAALVLDGQEYSVTMHNSQHYAVKDASGETVIQILHKGFTGGWEIEANDVFEPQAICAVFSFCRYIEQENEFPIV